MDASTLLLYIIAASAVMITPGPAMLLALNNGASHGMRVAGFGMAGAMLSDLILIAAVGCGLGALLQASEQLFSLVKWVGAAYLLYLAVVLWRAPVRALGASGGPAAVSGRSTFFRALIVGLSNPKGLLFFSAFLPQFIRPDQPVLQQYLVLAVITASLDCLMMIVYALGGRHAVRAFSARVMQWINRGCAGMLAVLAVGLSLYRRNDLH
ncbi:LysE family translocator [Pseudomonas putida]|uniref:Homoserine/homoserine lactone efflux protein n=1 Tax=Pseudomonas putida TaxID=303 RepID=A0A1Q9R6Q5_PSEPU|nr:LysE family translocator [Pseudomonas putida]OLS63099.1 Homoserine/homoserine lactone efflux protein [Pseudomonas putida]